MSGVDRRRLLQTSAAFTPLLLLGAGADGHAPAVPSGDGLGADATVRVSVRDFGATGDGEADDTDGVRAALRSVLDGRGDDGQVSRELLFPAGTYRITRPDTLLASPSDGRSEQVRGLTLRGVGKRSSEIFFDHDARPSSDPFANNLMTAANRLRTLRVTGLAFRSENPHNNWIYCWSRDDDDRSLSRPAYGTGDNQDFVLNDVEWRGRWNRVIGLDGDSQSNLNSEWSFTTCHISNSGAFTDAFLHAGMSPQHPQQDQFLNFWFTACKFEYAAGTLLKLAKGGFVNVFGGSWIAGVGSEARSTMFHMPSNSHFRATQNLVVIGTRFELRHRDARLLDCAWSGASAHLTFQNVSDAAYAHLDWAPDSTPVLLAPRDGALPSIRFTNCELMGRHRVVGARPGTGRVVYESCNLANHPDGGVGEDSGFLRYEGQAPSHRFVDCYGLPDSQG